MMALPLHAQTIELSNESLSVGVSEKRGHISRWQPKPLNANMPQMHDFAHPAQQLVQLGGFIEGEDLRDLPEQLGGWQLVRTTSNFVQLKLVNAAHRYELHQSLQLDPEHPWQAKYSVWLHTNNDVAIDASLWIDIGPGLGEEPAHDLGAAQSLYSFTEGVIGGGDVVTRLIAQPIITSSEYPAQLDWLGLQTRYFAFLVAPTPNTIAWELSVPEPLSQQQRKYTEFKQTMRVKLPKLSLNQVPIYLQIYGGGKSYSVLKAAHPSLEEILFPGMWGWMRGLTFGLMKLLDALHALVNNWGLAILFLAVLVRLLIYPVARRVMTAQQKFVALQDKIKPELQAIKQKYRGGEQSEAILRLYEKHNTSPLAGIKPLIILLLQLPIFVALYHLLGQHFELRE